MKNSLGELISTMEMTEKESVNLKREKKTGENRASGALWDNNRKSNVHIIEVPKKRRSYKAKKTI